MTPCLTSNSSFKDEPEAALWNQQVNENKVKINWNFDRKQARKKFRYQPNFMWSEH